MKLLTKMIILAIFATISFLILTFAIGINFLIGFIINSIDSYYPIKEMAVIFIILELYVVWLIIFSVATAFIIKGHEIVEKPVVDVPSSAIV
jgi:hypothetical protein